MTLLEFSHFAHVLAFAVVIGVDLPAFYAAKRAADMKATPDVRLLAARIVRWSNMLSSAGIALLLPLGLAIGVNLGVYAASSDSIIGVILALGLAWFVLVVLTEVLGETGLGKKLYTFELWFRGVIGLSCVFDGINGFVSDGSPIETNWLALKVLLLGLVLVASAVIRARLKPVRAALGEINPLSAQLSSWDARTAQEVTDALQRVRPLVHSVFLFVLIAAWMGITKSWL